MKDALKYLRTYLVDMVAEYEGEYVAIIEDDVIDYGIDVKSFWDYTLMQML